MIGSLFLLFILSYGSYYTSFCRPHHFRSPYGYCWVLGSVMSDDRINRVSGILA
ncbi:hypothetical protein HanIR_Chr04g0204881 [Helianthus annuus]|nr:hypothetical protein HanIR_Chr04g0204881 [Helianthus annuus]